MPIFHLKATDGSVELIVRAQCLSCARTKAAEDSGPEGPRVWRDPDMSTVTLVRDGDRTAVIMRSVRDE